MTVLNLERRVRAVESQVGNADSPMDPRVLVRMLVWVTLVGWHRCPDRAEDEDPWRAYRGLIALDPKAGERALAEIFVETGIDYARGPTPKNLTAMTQLLDSIPLVWRQRQRRFSWWPVSSEAMWDDPPTEAEIAELQKAARAEQAEIDQRGLDERRAIGGQ
jgi:hypothetical protein